MGCSCTGRVFTNCGCPVHDPSYGRSPPQRSSMFFASDVSSAAGAAAFAMEEHGLAPGQVEELADEIEGTINEFFASRGR